MQAPYKPDNEASRLAALALTKLLDTHAEPRFDRITRLAQLSLSSDIVLVSLVDQDRQWFKSKQGLAACETGRDVSFCGHAILAEDIFEIPDAFEDARFADNPLVVGAPFVRFYAGVPLKYQGHIIGTLCFIDSQPRTLSTKERQMAIGFASVVEQEIEDRLQEQAHNQLIASEKMYRSVLEGTRIGTWQWNVQTGETVFNDRWAEIVGYSLAELEPVSIETWLSLAHPDDLEESGRLLKAHFDGQIPFYDYKCRMRHKLGHDVWVHDRGRVVSWAPDGQPLMMYGTHADISEQKRAERLLVDSRDQLIKLTQHLPGVVYQFQLWPDGRSAFPYASDTIKSIYGVTPEEVVEDASAAFARIHPDDVERVVQCINHSRDHQTIWQDEYRVYRDDQSIMWVSGSATPEKMPDGSTLWHGYIQDVTQTKEYYLMLEQLNQRLNLAQQRLDVASEQAKIGYWQASLKNGSLWWSPIIYHIFGFDPEEVQPSVTLFKSMVHPDDAVMVEHSEEQAKLTGIHNVEHRIIRSDGEIRWVHELAQLMPEAQNPEQIMVGSVQDITERMKLQKMKEEFISTVSHELRTPLTSISGALNLLQSAQLVSAPEKAAKLISIASNNCQQLMHLISDLLDIEKLVAGKMSFEMRPVSIRSVMQRAMHDHELYSGSKSVQFELVIGPGIDEVVVVSDEHRLMQILANFLSNAVKFSPQEGKVSLSAHLDSSVIEMGVQDEGDGVPDEFRSRIFERFSQADTSISKMKGGTGLGLSLCKELVEGMGGSIGYTSTVGCGARFYVRLPI